MKNWSFIVDLFHRALPVLKMAGVMYVTATAALWTAVRLLSPVAPEFSLARGLCAVFLMTVLGNSLQSYLGPAMGNWSMLVKLLMDVLIVKLSFSLSFWRSTIVALVYCVAVAAVFYFYIHHFGAAGVTPRLSQ